MFDLIDFDGFHVKIQILAIISLSNTSVKTISQMPMSLFSTEAINPHDLLEEVSNWIAGILPTSYNFLSLFSFKKKTSITNIPWLVNFDHLQLLSGRIWDVSTSSKNNRNQHISSGTDLVEGLAFVRGMCQSRFSVSIARAPGVDSKHSTSRLVSQRYQAQIIAHELGHSLGASHDGLENYCPGSGYIMQPSAISMGRPLASGWSKCSVESISEYLNHPDSSCLDIKNVPTTSLCGNGIVDDGEECDSGSPSGSICCTSTCKLTSGSECDDRNGRCCQNCILKKKGETCRSLSTIFEKNSCDILDVCDGSTTNCPDLWKPEGSECIAGDISSKNGKFGVCDSGVCFSRAAICKRMGMEYRPECDPDVDCLIHCYDPTSSLQSDPSIVNSNLKEFEIIHSIRNKIVNLFLPFFENSNSYSGYSSERCITFALSSPLPSSDTQTDNSQLEHYRKSSLFQAPGTPLILSNGVNCSNKYLKEPGRCFDGSCVSKSQYEYEIVNVNNRQTYLKYVESQAMTNQFHSSLVVYKILLIVSINIFFLF